MKNLIPWVKKVVRDFDRGTRGRFLRKAVPSHRGGVTQEGINCMDEQVSFKLGKGKELVCQPFSKVALSLVAKTGATWVESLGGGPYSDCRASICPEC